MEEIYEAAEMYEAAESILDANRGVDLDGWSNWDLLVLTSSLIFELGRREEEKEQCRH